MMASMLVEAEIWTVARTDQGNAVLVRPLGSEVAVPIFIGQLETQSILIGLGNVPMPRPLTHDLFITLLKSLSVEIDRVEITNLNEGTFFAQLLLKKEEEEEITLDVRPSDALGIAVRTKCPIFISEAVVDEAGIPITSITEQATEGGETAGTENERESLENELKLAVESENYEEAARLRDLLKELDNEQNRNS
ncbi:bifunctional nuclease family protein [Sediminispirochaeta smaragdinae]|jgi:hypothetical protein|uniref:BFN domain-containing protein n=1 Tax=Sediminispirochaeta smaragdinae (strain DSM 11293 / JCM 15392 / SEBR 4228) TaxID=573413 RepID=E1RAD2_SEDSS|nr:bifunctional nuclease family protein [Sediminispirochaeta smaragdinae]ADK79423.1 protein of unknown function DUF151 [Sediminispirochaeta smaragdinae DSM 11293]